LGLFGQSESELIGEHSDTFSGYTGFCFQAWVVGGGDLVVVVGGLVWWFNFVYLCVFLFSSLCELFDHK